MKKAYISGGSRYGEQHLLKQYGWEVTFKLEEANVVIFTGGEDVDPELYNEPQHSRTWPSENGRDMREILDFQKALALGIPMFGICRGAQLLCVMDGGRLVQHCTEHATAKGHDILIIDTGEVFPVTSAHHQMLIPSGDAEIIAVSPMKCQVEVYNHSTKRFDVMDRVNTPEIVLFPKIKAIGVQGHPEFQQHDADLQRFRDYCMAAMEALIPETQEQTN